MFSKPTKEIEEITVNKTHQHNFESREVTKQTVNDIADEEAKTQASLQSEDSRAWLLPNSSLEGSGIFGGTKHL